MPQDSPQNHAHIDEDVFDHLVNLAAFYLEAEEKEYLRKELNAQLKAIRELEALAVDDSIPITSHGVPYTDKISAPLREDVVQSCPEADDIVDGAPESDLRYIVVPDIPHEELE